MWAKCRAVKVHLIAVGGTGMGAFACLLAAAGHDVRGSDTHLYPPMSTQLERVGIPVFEGFAAENLDWGPDVVVVGNVCRRDHLEVLAAQQRGLRLESFPSLLEQTLLSGRRSLVVAGTHGKTTTSSLLASLMTAAGLDPSFLIGGVPQNLGRGFALGAGPSMVIEGDEYDTAFFDKKSKFLHYRPQRAILTGVEFDHADIFDDEEAILSAFREFVGLIPADGQLVVAGDSPKALAVASACAGEVITYGVLTAQQDVDAFDYACRAIRKPGARRTRFEIFERGEGLGEFSTLLVGDYNLANILAAFAIARLEGAEIEALRVGLRTFRGIKRRQELVGVAQGVRVLDDFAHHPTAVRLTVTALRRRYPDKNLRVCFEPRSATSRRSVFFEEFASSFDAADAVYIAPLYAPEKIPEDSRLDVGALAKSIAFRGVRTTAFDSTDALRKAVLADAGPGDTVVLLSSGSFDDLGRKLLHDLGDPVMFGAREDAPAIDALLERCGLSKIAPGSTVESLVLREPDETVVGCVNLEVVSDHEAYLFGLAVEQPRRNEGLGWVLADSVLRRARTLGTRAVYLLTRNSANFFAKRLGFRAVDSAEVPQAIQASENYQAEIARAKTCMRFDLPAS